MEFLRRVVAKLFLLALLTGLASADILVMKDGRRIEGRILERTAKEIRVKTSVGELTVLRKDVVEIIEKKTREELYDEKLAAAKTADDFFELGNWCVEQRWKRRAPKHWEKAIELDTDHAGARAALGFARYEDRWVTLAEKERLEKEKLAAEKAAQGLVEYQGRWVTPKEKEKLEKGLVEHKGRWVTPDELRVLQGEELFEGVWYPAAEAKGRAAVRGAEEAAGKSFNVFVGQEAILAGDVSASTLEEISRGLDRVRAWFDGEYEPRAGLKLYGGRLAEFYVFRNATPYRATVGYLAGRSNYIPEGWEAAVKAGLGFTWSDPITISSAHRGPRETKHVIGQSYHHFGHLLVNRHRYRGKLLPPWYDEGLAALAEMRAHGQNFTFCRSSFNEGQEGSSTGGERAFIPDSKMRDGAWRHVLEEELKARRLPSFDKLAQREFSQLQAVDIAMSMAIVEWLDDKDALAPFHKALREGAPPAPKRVYLKGNERQSYFDSAFQKAVGMGWREADQTWRTHFLNR